MYNPTKPNAFAQIITPLSSPQRRERVKKRLRIALNYNWISGRQRNTRAIPANERSRRSFGRSAVGHRRFPRLHGVAVFQDGRRRSVVTGNHTPYATSGPSSLTKASQPASQPAIYLKSSTFCTCKRYWNVLIDCPISSNSHSAPKVAAHL